VPQGYINGTEAAAACAEAGKRLCSNAEWLRACQGPSTTTYPYGNTRMPGVCNDARSVHPAVEYFGTTDPSIYTMLDNACLNQLPASLAAAGTYAGCVSAEGLHDMMGNLHEWTADAAGAFRGGFYVDTTINGNGCLYVTTAHDTSHWDYSTGFRCCADPL
jgi:formylglycine-generating enzyme required for sulfatase activity